MRIIRFTPVARARIWPQINDLAFPVAGELRTRIASRAIIDAVWSEHLILEVYVPRGARVEYGLLGLLLEKDRDGVEVVVPYSAGISASLAGSLASGLDDVRVGLPEEYAGAVLAALLASEALPNGLIRVCAAAHGAVGSSPKFFARLTAAALVLMRDGTQDPDRIAELLRRALI